MIGIMSAMQEEIQALFNQLENPIKSRKGKRDYYQGTLFGKKVVLVFSRWGKVASATTATQLINDFDLKELIFTGVAGAIDPNLNIGDIVIGKKLVQHDMNASPLYNAFEIPLLNKTFFETNSLKREALTKASNLFISNFTSVISEKEAKTFHIKDPKVFVGDIASGDQFISKKTQTSFISKNLPNVLCTEMEGAAVAQVCYEYKIPFSILRIISDKANDNSHIDFPLFAKQIASKYALNIFESLFTNKVIIS